MGGRGAGGLQEGMERYKEAQEADPEYSTAYFNMGVAIGETGSPDRALEQYRQAVALQPRYAEAHCNMGVIHKQKVRWQRPCKCLVVAPPAPHGVLTCRRATMPLCRGSSRTRWPATSARWTRRPTSRWCRAISQSR